MFLNYKVSKNIVILTFFNGTAWLVLLPISINQCQCRHAQIAYLLLFVLTARKIYFYLKNSYHDNLNRIGQVRLKFDRENIKIANMLKFFACPEKLAFWRYALLILRRRYVIIMSVGTLSPSKVHPVN